jgi:uncharacterized protein YgiM (DUF1202 family)
METLAFVYAHVGYEDPGPEPELRSFKDLADGISSSASLGIAGAAMSLSIMTHTPVLAAMQPGSMNLAECPAQTALVTNTIRQPENFAIAYVNTNGDPLNVRSGPGTGYSVINSLADGTRIVIVQQQGNWAQIQGGGWVSANWISVTESNPGSNPGGLSVAYVSTNGDPLNVHDGPGISYSVINSLADGTRIVIVQQQGDWAQIQGGGWVSTNWISATESNSGGNPGGYGSSYVDTNGDPLNIRSGPGSGYSIVGSLPNHTPVTIVARQGSWGELSNGGWVSLNWVVS